MARSLSIHPFPRAPVPLARSPAAGPGRNSANFMSEPSPPNPLPRSQPIRTDSFTYARSRTPSIRSSSPEVVEVPESEEEAEEEVVEGERDAEDRYTERYQDYVVPIPPETPPRTRRHGTPLPRAQSASSYVSRPSWGTNRSRSRALSPDVFDAVTEHIAQQRRATPGVRGRPRARRSAAEQEEDDEEDFESMPRGRPLTRLASSVSPTKRAASAHTVRAPSNNASTTNRRSQSAAAARIAVPNSPTTRKQPQRGRPTAPSVPSTSTPAALSITEAISQSLTATPHAATTYQPSFALPVGPPKRPRGRPRIHPLVPKSQVVKRGPGRPRKHPLPLESEVVKKPLGRPRKHPLPTEGEVVKRSPGRPRKNPFPPIVANDHHERQVTQDGQVVKRSPGRPRKNPLPSVDRPAAQVEKSTKRPRGRPRKVSLPAVGSLRDIDERPATQAEEPVKRPRGRPRKSAPAALPAAFDAHGQAPVRMSLVPVNVYGRSASKAPARAANVAPQQAPYKIRPEQASPTAGPSTPSHPPPRNRAYVLIDSKPSPAASSPAARAARVERICAGPECENRLPPRGKYRFASCRSCRARKVVAAKNGNVDGGVDMDVDVDVNGQQRDPLASATAADTDTPTRAAVEQARVVERHGWTLLTENPEDEEEEEEEEEEEAGEGEEGEEEEEGGFEVDVQQPQDLEDDNPFLRALETMTSPVRTQPATGMDTVMFTHPQQEEEEEEEDQLAAGPSTIASATVRNEKRKTPPTDASATQQGWTRDPTTNGWHRAPQPPKDKDRPRFKPSTLSSLPLPVPASIPEPPPSAPAFVLPPSAPASVLRTAANAAPEPLEYQTSAALHAALAAERARGGLVRFKGSWAVIVAPETLVDEVLVRRVADELVRESGYPATTDRNNVTIVLRGTSGTMHMQCECASLGVGGGVGEGEGEGMVRQRCRGQVCLTVGETGERMVVGITKGLRVLVEVTHPTHF